MTLHWKRFEKFVLYVGCHFVRQRGDHRIYWREGLSRPVVFPQDPDIPDFVLRNNLRVLGVGYQQFLKILKEL